MTYIITFIAYISNILNLFSKKNNWIPLLFVLVLWILFWGNYDNPDYYNYLWGYNDTSDAFGEPAFNMIAKLLKNLGFDYHFFVAALSLISYTLLHKTLKKYVENSSYIYLLYFIYPFMLDVVQIRNFIAMAIFVYAVPFLLTNKVKDKLIYALLVLLAASFQLSIIAFLPFLVVKDIKFNNTMKLVVVFTILSASFIVLNPSLINQVGVFLANLLNDPRFLRYFARQTNLGFLLLWFTQFITFLLISYSKKVIVSKFETNLPLEENENRISSFTKLVYKINIYSFLFFPLLILTSTFFRLNRNLSVLYYIIFYLTSKSFYPRSKEKFLYNVIVISFVIFLFLIEIYLSYSETIVFPIFESNLLFNYFQ